MAKQRTVFTLLELVAIFVVLGVLFALLPPALQRMRESARRTQCEAHLKRIGTGVQHFYDARKALPPIVVFAGKASVFCLLYPYIEEQRLDDILKEPGGNMDLPNGLWGDQWFVKLLKSEAEDDRRKVEALGSVSLYRCPSRRSMSAPLYAGIDPKAETNNNGMGPRGDYAVPVYKKDYAFWESFCLIGPVSEKDSSTVDDFRGPLRVSLPSFRHNRTGNNPFNQSDLIGWEPRDTMDFWQDGKSNQLLVGEKNIPSFALESNEVAHRHWDGGYQYVFPVHVVYNVGRLIHEHRVPLAVGPDDSRFPKNRTPNGIGAQYLYGSSHPGVCQFLFGDGSVKPIDVTTPASMMSKLARVDDNAIQEP